MSKPQLGRLQSVDLREYWESEPQDFTPWLAEEDNIALLGETLGVELEVQQTEAAVGSFSADIVCRNTADGSVVLIENQLERTDHTHLGQIFTYAAGLDAVTTIWIARRFTEEHRAAIDWLNSITHEGFNFFGLEIELWRIGDSTPAPKFNVVAKPNEWSKVVREAAAGGGGPLTPAERIWIDYWTAFGSFLEEQETRFRPPKPRKTSWIGYGIGRTGFNIWVMVATRDKHVDVGISFTGPDAKAHFSLLRQQQEEIEHELGFAIDWQEKPGQKESTLSIQKHAETTDTSLWPELHAWTLEKMEALDRIFRPRIKVLDASDWRFEEEDG
jgi:hypothetical protein